MSDHVLIFGLGGIGSIYACLLQFSENCLVHVVARSKYKAVRDHGLKLISSKFGEHTGVTFAGGVWLGASEAES
jgi:2-dehydropantoate 2-reductase